MTALVALASGALLHSDRSERLQPVIYSRCDGLFLLHTVSIRHGIKVSGQDLHPT